MLSREGRATSYKSFLSNFVTKNYIFRLSLCIGYFLTLFL